MQAQVSISQCKYFLQGCKYKTLWHRCPFTKMQMQLSMRQMSIFNPWCKCLLTEMQMQLPMMQMPPCRNADANFYHTIQMPSYGDVNANFYHAIQMPPCRDADANFYHAMQMPSCRNADANFYFVMPMLLGGCVNVTFYIMMQMFFTRRKCNLTKKNFFRFQIEALRSLEPKCFKTWFILSKGHPFFILVRLEYPMQHPKNNMFHSNLRF